MSSQSREMAGISRGSFESLQSYMSAVAQDPTLTRFIDNQEEKYRRLLKSSPKTKEVQIPSLLLKNLLRNTEVALRDAESSSRIVTLRKTFDTFKAKIQIRVFETEIPPKESVPRTQPKPSPKKRQSVEGTVLPVKTIALPKNYTKPINYGQLQHLEKLWEKLGLRVGDLLQLVGLDDEAYVTLKRTKQGNDQYAFMLTQKQILQLQDKLHAFWDKPISKSDSRSLESLGFLQGEERYTYIESAS